jgi:hypothetical protein
LKTGLAVIEGLADSVHHCLNVRVDHNQPCFSVSRESISLGFLPK